MVTATKIDTAPTLHSSLEYSNLEYLQRRSMVGRFADDVVNANSEIQARIHLEPRPTANLIHFRFLDEKQGMPQQEALNCNHTHIYETYHSGSCWSMTTALSDERDKIMKENSDLERMHCEMDRKSGKENKEYFMEPRHAKLESLRNDKETRIQSLKEILHGRDNAITDLEDTVAQQVQMMQSLSVQLDELCIRASDLETQIEERNELVELQKSRLRENEELLIRLEGAVKQQSMEVTMLQSEAQVLRKQVEEKTCTAKQ